MSKVNISPTKKEIKLDENDFIVSKTDVKGKISYCNEIFMKIAAYDEKELLNSNHNIIRHPDMPKVAFKLAWDLISRGDEFFGFVKNMSKNGDFYWVFTNITADYIDGKIIGYTSVRRKAKPSAITAITPIYAKLIELEKHGGMKESGNFLFKFLEEKGLTYDELVLSLQGV